MKKNNNYLYYLVIILLLVNISLNLFTSFNKDKNITAEKIFKSSMYSVVEVKATTEDIGDSFGSAVFVCKDGTLVTNAHVVTYKQLNVYYEFNTIEIRFCFENDYRPVSIIKYDKDLDIALLKLNDVNCDFKPVSFSDSKACKTGNLVYAVGNLNNVGLSMSKGIVSNPSINVEYNDKTRNVIQCDLTIADGNSGGALFDESGKLLGITTFRLKDSSKNVIYGIAYCVPANVVLEYIK